MKNCIAVCATIFVTVIIATSMMCCTAVNCAEIVSENDKYEIKNPGTPGYSYVFDRSKGVAYYRPIVTNSNGCTVVSRRYVDFVESDTGISSYLKDWDEE